MSKIEPVGRTTDGQIVVSGVFALRATIGLPFTDIFDVCRDRQIMPSWEHLYREARADGWNHETIIRQLDEALVDSYGKDFRDHVLPRIERLREIR